MKAEACFMSKPNPGNSLVSIIFLCHTCLYNLLIVSLGYKTIVFRRRMFKGSETVNDLNSVDPLGGFCGFIVFSSARFSGRLNPLSCRRW